MFKSIRSYIAAAAIAIASIATTTDVNAQIMRSEDASTSPREMTFGVGGGVNLNMAGGDFNPMQTGPSSYGVGDYHTPSFHAELEVPITSNLRGAARVSYNDLSSVIDDDASGNTVAQSDMRAFSYRTVGTDLMAKYTVIDNLHLIGGGNVSISTKRSYAMGQDNVQAASASQSEMDAPELMISAMAGAGYDIPLTTDSKVWLTPEVTYNLPLKSLAQGDNDGDLRVNTLASKITLKFGLGD
jgi:hypothetical protein